MTRDELCQAAVAMLDRAYITVSKIINIFYIPFF